MSLLDMAALSGHHRLRSHRHYLYITPDIVRRWGATICRLWPETSRRHLRGAHWRSWRGFGVDAITPATTTGIGVGQWAAHVFETRACSMLDAVSVPT